jgi:hypothetical protein
MQDLFLGVTDFARRADILEHFLTTKELIPSLWTLISDIKCHERQIHSLKGVG